MKWRTLLVSGLCLMALVACDRQKQETKAPEQAAPQAAAPEAAAPAPQVGEEQAVKATARVQGKAKEVLNGGGFTYVLIAGEKGDTWVAVPETKIAVGEACAIVEGQLMQNFSSKTLNRTFNEIIFATGLEGKKAVKENSPHGGSAAMAPHAAPAASGGDFSSAMKKEAGGAPSGASPHASAPEATPGSGKAVVPFADLKVPKATGENAHTVADVFGKAKALNGKKVKIKGQVVKFSPQIMGKNWIHIQDGTGDAGKNTHDLVVTTAGKAEKGDVITVEGVLAADKDFGSGYKYAVIVEDVTITR